MPDRVVSYVFRGNFTNLTAGLAASGKAVGDLGGKLTALDKNGAKQRAGLKAVGDTAGKVGLVAAAGLGAAVLASAKFDKAMSAVQAATHETTGNMELLRAAAIKAGADTAFSATEAAGAIEQLSKAGVSSKDILAGGLSGALDLAAAGQLEVADAAEIAASALTQFQLSGADVPHVADLLAAGAGKAQGSVQDLGYALKYAGVPANALGVSIEETTGVLAEFASAGIVGEQAGTTLRSMLLSLAAPSKQASELMGTYGLSLYDASGKFIGMRDAADRLQQTLGPLTEAERNHALSVIFGKEAIQGAITLYQGGGQAVTDWTGKVNDSGYAAETAAIQMDNLAGDIESFKGSLETALIGVGDGSQGPLRKLVSGATSAVNALNALPDGAKNSAAALLGITAVLGGGLWFTSKTVQGIANTKSALSDLGITSSTTAGKLARIGKAAGGITAVGIAVGIVADNIGRIDSSNLDRSLDALGRGEVTDTVEEVVNSMAQLNSAWNKVDLGEIVTGFGLFGDTSLDKFSNNVEQVDQALAGLVETGKQAEAASIFNKISDLAAKQGVSPAETAKAFDALALALRNAKSEAGGAEGAEGDLAGATGALGSASVKAASRIKRVNEVIAKNRETAGEAARSFLAFGDSLDDSKVSLGQWIAQMRRQATALRNFRVNAQQAAKKGLDEGLIASLEEAGAAGALRMRQLANATRSEIGRANGAWRSGQREVNRYTDAIGGVPRTVKTDITANTEAAAQRIASIRSQLDAIPRVISTSYYVNQMRTITTLSTPGGRDGDPATPYATGGAIRGPGTGTSDDVPIWASNGEHMWTAREVRNAGGHAAVEAIRNQYRYAEGGAISAARYAAAAYSGSPTASAGTERVVVERVVERLAGTVTLVDKDGAIGEFVVRQARGEVDADRGYGGRLFRQGVERGGI